MVVLSYFRGIAVGGFGEAAWGKRVNDLVYRGKQPYLRAIHDNHLVLHRLALERSQARGKSIFFVQSGNNDRDHNRCRQPKVPDDKKHTSTNLFRQPRSLLWKPFSCWNRWDAKQEQIKIRLFQDRPNRNKHQNQRILRQFLQSEDS